MKDLIALDGKTALVTGGARRLGRAVCEALARAGAHVVIHYRRSEAEARALEAALEAAGGRAWCVKGDLDAPESAPDILQRAVELAGPIDFLINNASIFPAQTFWEMEAAAVQENVNVNALSPVWLARAFARQQRQGAVVNFLDTRTFEYDKQHLPYHLSKRMLFTLTKIMALEFAPRVRVNAVAPGLILPPEGKDEEYLEQLRSTNPLCAHGSPEGIADATLFLLRSGFMTGQVLFVDGGRHLLGDIYG